MVSLQLPPEAPGTGTPLPNGLHPKQTFDLIRKLEPSSFTLAEVDPLLDINGVTLKHSMEAIHASVGDHKHVDVICAPMNLGQENPGPALTPTALLDLGLVKELNDRGISTSVKTAEV